MANDGAFEPTGADVDPIRPERVVAFDGYTVLLTQDDGRIEGDGTGLFDMDARILSRHEIRVNGCRLEVVGPSGAEANRWNAVLKLDADQIHGDRARTSLPQDAFELRIVRTVGCGMDEELTLINHSMTETRVTVTLDVAADFLDALEIDRPRRARGRVGARWNDRRRTLTIAYHAEHGDRTSRRAVRVRVLGDARPTARPLLARPWKAPDGAHRLTFEPVLRPHEPWVARIIVESWVEGSWRSPDAAHAPPNATTPAGRDAARTAWRTARTHARSSDPVVGRAFERAAEDLLALRNWDIAPRGDALADDWVANAGVPRFTGLFGRDALTTAWQSLVLGPEIPRGVLTVIADTQGRRYDPWREEQPGRMVHEMRRGPVAELNIRPHARYYGSQTTGSMFVLALAETWHWTGDDELLRRHRDAAMRATEWALRDGDLDGDGFLEYVQRSPEGLKNQGWKDSNEAIRDEGGRVVDNPIATVEEQAFHIVALERMAEVLVVLDEEAAADDLLERVRRLRRGWHQAFWLPDEGFYALALGPDKRPLGTIASNAGHALAAGVVPRELAARVGERLLAPDLFSGWGIRTLSADHPSYNPFAYHLGTVWPVENAAFAVGLKRYGLDDPLERLIGGLFEAIARCRDFRVPEALTGHSRDEHPVPVPYPRANSPQAWSASATVQLVVVLLGLYPFAPAGVLGLVRPRLPAGVDRIDLRGLRVGEATIDLRFTRRADGAATHEILAQDGRLAVVEVPPPQDVDADDASIRDRLALWAIDHAPGRVSKALRIALGSETESVAG